MDAKDYFTTGVSLVALCLSVGALSVSYRSYRLAQRRDQRELDAKLPRIDIAAPDCDGLGPWPIAVTITNRDDVPITLERLVSDANRVVELQFGAQYPVGLARMMDSTQLNYATLGARLSPSESVTINFEIVAYMGKRVATGAEAIFGLDYRSDGDDPSTRRRSARIKLNP